MRRPLLLALTLAVTTAVVGAAPSLPVNDSTTTLVSETTSTTYVYTIPPAEQACVDRPYEKTFRCQFQRCLEACGASATCRRLCARSRRLCLSGNGCDVMHWPFCAGGSFQPCGYPSDGSTCTRLHLVNRTHHVITTTSVDGVDLGISLAPGGEADAYVSPSRSGATIGAVADSAAAAGGRCEWRVVLKGCLEVGVRHRVVFRQRAASCAS